MRLVLDTNVFVVGFIDLAAGVVSPETRILVWLMRKEAALLLSQPIEEQIMRVIMRVKNKDFAGLVRHAMWSDFDVEFVHVAKAITARVNRKDAGIFGTAFEGNADCLVSNNARFLEEAKQSQKRFECISPLEFVSRYVDS